MAVWTVKGGQQGELEARLLSLGFLGGGWDRLGSLAEIASREELASAYALAYPDIAYRAATTYIAQLWSLTARMEIGELVVLPLKRTRLIAVGRIAGPYEHRVDLGVDLRHVRPVEWTRRDVPREVFASDLLQSFGTALTIGQVRRDDAEERILAALP